MRTKINRNKAIKYRKNYLEDDSCSEQNNGANNNNFRENKLTLLDKSFSAPEVFDFIKNTEKSIEFLNDIIVKRNKIDYNSRFNINFSNVKALGCDALMYLIAIMTDTRVNEKNRKIFSGNFPSEGDSKKLFCESGFLNYVRSEEKEIKSNVDRIQIRQAKNNDPKNAKKVCLFIQKNAGYSRTETSGIYKSFVEMMGNTIQHAYEEKKHINKSARHWYFYAEVNEECIKCVFLDTGDGIPNTVTKKFMERIPKNCTDSKLINSALNGEYRTRTKEHYRGGGLPMILKTYNSDIIKSGIIISGRGICKYENKVVHMSDIKEELYGTLFMWNVVKKGYRNG